MQDSLAVLPQRSYIFDRPNPGGQVRSEADENPRPTLACLQRAGINQPRKYEVPGYPSLECGPSRLFQCSPDCPAMAVRDYIRTIRVISNLVSSRELVGGSRRLRSQQRRALHARAFVAAAIEVSDRNRDVV